jgi:hypothetical protein
MSISHFPCLGGTILASTCAQSWFAIFTASSACFPCTRRRTRSPRSNSDKRGIVEEPHVHGLAMSTQLERTLDVRERRAKLDLDFGACGSDTAR